MNQVFITLALVSIQVKQTSHQHQRQITALLTKWCTRTRQFKQGIESVGVTIARGRDKENKSVEKGRNPDKSKSKKQSKFWIKLVKVIFQTEFQRFQCHRTPKYNQLTPLPCWHQLFRAAYNTVKNLKDQIVRK